jgi:putative tricarboxylic transport membrane protein
MLGGIVTHRSPVTLRDITPIARLTGEYEVVVVPPTSRFASLRDLLQALRADPTSISWGGGSAGGSDHILAGLLADAAGAPARQVNYIAFSGGGESLAAIVGGQVHVGINGLAELAAQIQAGTVRALGISSAERIPGFDVPTFREQGVDLVFENWRSVVAPPGISNADRERMTRAVEAMVHSQPWRQALERYRWIDRYMAGDAFAAFTDSEERRVHAVLRKLGTEREAAPLDAAGPYPIFVLGGLAVTGIAAVIAGIGSSRRAPRLPRRSHQAEAGRSHQAEAGRSRQARAGQWQPAIMVGAGVVSYLLLAERLGFVVASAALFWLTARAFDEHHPWRDAVVAVTTSIAAYLLFVRLLDLSLPPGILEHWL